ncbi:MAG: universal stress protein [Bdellovibrionales bacterium]|nr:universal stress protein [Bdellovibrionales bacterium]
MNPVRPFRIVWAVDPLGEETAFQSAAAALLHSVAAKLDAEVYPIYLYGGYPLEFAVYSPPEVSDKTRKDAGERLQEIVKDRPIGKLRDLETLVKPYVTLREGVDRFVERAVEVGADFVVATTHARKGVTRWLIGSFAEALTEKSTVPVLVVNPEAKSEWEIGSVVFATDFSEESKRAFCALLQLAKAFGAEVTLYHKLTHLISPRLEPAFSESSLDRKNVEERSAKTKALAEEWVRVGKDGGVRVTPMIDARIAGSPADATVEAARERRAWIAIAARRGKVAATLLGSTARRILRNADVPVWVYRAPPVSAYCPDFSITENEIARDLGLRRDGEDE